MDDRARHRRAPPDPRDLRDADVLSESVLRPDHRRRGSHDHPHEHFGPVDPSFLATRQGIRTTWISLGGLATTALVQLAVVLVSGSVALLADTIHNFADGLTAIPLLIAFRLARRPPS